MAPILPTLFVGHGNPLNALADNVYTETWRRLGAQLPKPRAILAISAHWCLAETAVTAAENQRTIHDFGGFPQGLFDVQYPAAGDRDLCSRVKQLLAPTDVSMDTGWGLDHGTWSVLTHLYPQADVPVIQLSIDESQAPSFHFALGRKLAALRTEGVLILGSGNVVHNLRAYRWGKTGSTPQDWATRFEADVQRRLLARDHAGLIEYEKLGPDAKLAVPTPEHYVPLLYVAGASHADDQVSFPCQGIDGGSISMLTVQFGAVGAE